MSSSNFESLTFEHLESPMVIISFMLVINYLAVIDIVIDSLRILIINSLLLIMRLFVQIEVIS